MNIIELIEKPIKENIEIGINSNIDTNFSGKSLFIKSLLNGENNIFKKDENYFFKSSIDEMPGLEVLNVDQKDENNFRFIKKIGEENTRELVKKGNKYFIKIYVENVDYLKAIALAFKTYSNFNVKVPKLEKIDLKNGIIYLENIEGLSLGEYYKDSSEDQLSLINHRLSNDFLSHVLIGNDDILGQDGKNIIIDKNDVPYIINIISCFGFNKFAIKNPNWENEDCTELFTLRDPFINPTNSFIFKRIDINEINLQIDKIKINENSNDELENIIKSRYKNIYNYVKQISNIDSESHFSGGYSKLENNLNSDIYNNISEIKNTSVKNFYKHLNDQLPYTNNDKEIIISKPIIDGIGKHFENYGFESQKGEDELLSKFSRENGLFYFESFVLKQFGLNQDKINSYLYSCIHSLDGGIISGNFIDKGKTNIRYPDFNNVIDTYSKSLKKDISITNIEKQVSNILLTKIIANSISRAENNNGKKTFKQKQPFTVFRNFFRINDRRDLFNSLKDCKMFIHNMVSPTIYGIKNFNSDDKFSFLITTNNGIKIDDLVEKENIIIQKPFMPYSVEELHYDEGDDKYYVKVVDKSIM